MPTLRPTLASELAVRPRVAPENGEGASGLLRRHGLKALVRRGVASEHVGSFPVLRPCPLDSRTRSRRFRTGRHAARGRLEPDPSSDTTAIVGSGDMTVAARQERWRLVAPDDDSAIDLQPLQGLWTEAQYLRLTGGLRRLLEFTDGALDILPMPTDRHQVIVRVPVSDVVSAGGRSRRDGALRAPATAHP